MKKTAFGTHSQNPLQYLILLVVTLFVFSMAQPAFAQNDNTAEVFGGFSFLRAKPNDTTLGDINMPGWNASLTGYLKSWFGVTADFSGNYRTESLSINNLSARDYQIHQYGYVFGPRLRLLRTKRITGSIALLGGVAHGSVKDKLTSLSVDSTDGAMVAGSSIDININPHWAWRVQPNLYLTWFGSDTPQKNFRFSTGILYRFGGTSTP